MVSCAVCGNLSKREYHHYPNRKPPHNMPYVATMYHRDPFWGNGDLEEYCGAKCSVIAFMRTAKND
jgi:hypothetical protein